MNRGNVLFIAAYYAKCRAMSYLLNYYAFILTLRIFNVYYLTAKEKREKVSNSSSSSSSSLTEQQRNEIINNHYFTFRNDISH